MRVLAVLFWLWPALAFAFGTPKPLPILDQLSTMAIVCPSVRVVESAGYGQPILYERRSSDNATRAIYYQSNGMLDQYDAAAFAGSGSGYVTQWNSNCSPRIAVTGAYDVTQSTAASQPQIVASGVVETQNGVPSVYFGGSQYLKTTSTVQLSSVSGQWSSNCVVFASSVTSSPLLLSATTAGGPDGGQFAQFSAISSSGYFYSIAFNTSTNFTGGPLNIVGNIVTTVQNNVTLNIYSNGLGPASTSVGSNMISSSAVLSIGANPAINLMQYLTGFIGMGMIFSSNIGASDQQTFEVWEGQNFGISGVTQ